MNLPPTSTTYLEAPKMIEAALETTDNCCKKESIREPSFPLALTMTSWVRNCGKFSTRISLNFKCPANDRARSTVFRKSKSVGGATTKFSLNEDMRLRQYR